MKKFKFIIQYIDAKTANYWEEDFECRAWNVDGAIRKACHRGYMVLHGLNRTNPNIFFRPCGIELKSSS